MKYYDENLKALKLYDEELYESYIEWEKSDKTDGLIIEEDIARDGSIILNIIKEKKQYRLNSRYYPQKEAEEWCTQFELNNIDQIINIFGLGNLMFSKMLKEKARKDAKMVIYEPSTEIFAYHMKNMPIGEILLEKNVIVLIKELNGNKLYGILDFLFSWENVDSIITTVCPQYDKMYEMEYMEYCQQIKDGKTRTKIRANTVGYFGKEMVYNVTSSMCFLRKAQFIKQYERKFKEDIPAIIVSAGPSLDLNIDKLNQAKGKSVIIATDTAMRDLIKHNIEPDFIVTVDPKKPAEYLEHELCQNIPLFCLDTANRKILQRHRGQKIFAEVTDFLSAFCPVEIWDGVTLGKGGSVATAAFSICVALKFKTIILIGQDLAYRNGVSHAGNRMSGEEVHGDWLVEVEDIYGNIIKTRHEWYEFLLWFEDAVSLVKKTTKVIDATEGGAKIKGTELMSLEEAINIYCSGKVDCKKIVKEIGSFYSEEAYQNVLKEAEKAIRDNEKIIRETKILIMELERLIECCKKQQYGAEYKRITQSLVKKGDLIIRRPVYRLAEAWSADVVFKELSSVYHLGEEQETEEIRTYGTALEFYKKLNIACTEIMPILEEAYHKMTIKED